MTKFNTESVGTNFLIKDLLHWKCYRYLLHLSLSSWWCLELDLMWWLLCSFGWWCFAGVPKGDIRCGQSITMWPQAQAIQHMHPPKMPKEVHAFLGLVGYYREFIKNLTKIAKPLTVLTCQQANFEWTPTHHYAFLTLKESVIQTPILHYPNPRKCYIVYTDTLDDASRAQLSQEHDGTEFSIAFLSNTHSLTLNRNEAPQNKKLMVYITQLQKGIGTFREPK